MKNPKHDALSKKITMSDIKKSSHEHGVHEGKLVSKGIKYENNTSSWPKKQKRLTENDKLDYQKRTGRGYNE